MPPETCDLKLFPEEQTHELQEILLDRCSLLNDPDRASQLLTADIDKCILFASHLPGIVASTAGTSDGDAVVDAQQQLVHTASNCNVLIIQLLLPGFSYYNVFVGARSSRSPRADAPAAGDEALSDDDMRHQVRLFVSALRGVLSRPQPGRLSFAGVPDYAAEAMKDALRAAGHSQLWGYECFRYGTSSPPDLTAVEEGDRVLRELAAQGLSYELDELRTEADVQIVNQNWSFQSEYSERFVRLLATSRTNVCVRLRPNPAGGAGAAAESTASSVGAADPGSDAVAWILQYGDGSLGMAHTLKEHRKRGLMRLCTMRMMQRVLGAQEGAGGDGGDGGDNDGGGGCGGSGGGQQRRRQLREAYMFAVLDNATSIAVFEAMGLRRAPNTYHWFGEGASR